MSRSDVGEPTSCVVDSVGRATREVVHDAERAVHLAYDASLRKYERWTVGPTRVRAVGEVTFMSPT